jgi:hypothetical protein
MGSPIHPPTSNANEPKPNIVLELFVRGVLGFPWSASMRFRWFSLSLGAVLPLYLLLAALAETAGNARGGESLSGGLSILNMATWGLATVFAGLWLSIASTYCLAILRDTAAGNDEIENWPDTIWIDWITEGFYVINPLLGSIVPGALLNWYFKTGGTTYWLLYGGSFLVMFPIMLLSVVEGQFPMKLLTLPVLASLLVAFPLWMVFFLETALILGLAALAVASLTLSPIWGAVVIALIVVTTLVIYFRLLGRLAEYCTDIMPRT